MRSNLIFALVSLLSFSSAYLIDSKCSKGDAERIRKAMNSATSMVNNGLSLANNKEKENVELRRRLFGEKLTDDKHVERIKDVYGGILDNVKDEVHSVDGLYANDVRIYCDQSRLKFKGTYVWDENIKERIEWDSKIDCVGTFMWTTNAADQSVYSTIQICPWFLRYEEGWQFQTVADLAVNAWAKLAKLLDSPITKFRFSPIDLYGIFDKVMLHELTHLKACGKTNDVGGFSGYGWKSCLELAKKYDPQKIGAGPYENADTFALYGSACTLKLAGGKVNEDGTFEEPPNPNTSSGSAGTKRRRIVNGDSLLGADGNSTASSEIYSSGWGTFTS